VGRATRGDLTGEVVLGDTAAAAATNVDVVDLDMLGRMVAEYNFTGRGCAIPTKVDHGCANNMATLRIEGVVAASTVVSREVTLYLRSITDVVRYIAFVDGYDHCGTM